MVSLKHKFTSLKGDASDSTLVRPTDWNDEHDLTMSSASSVVGRDPFDPAVQELPFQVETSGRTKVLSTSGFTPAVGTTAERPVDGRPGELRWNTTTNEMEVFRSPGGWGPLVPPPEPDDPNIVPSGAIMSFPVGTAPNGWLFCDGSDHATVDHPRLFLLIGYSFGGAGAVFKVPDYRGRTLACIGKAIDEDITLSEKLGADKSSVTLTILNTPQHLHAGFTVDSDNPITGDGSSIGLKLYKSVDSDNALYTVAPVAAKTPFVDDLATAGRILQSGLINNHVSAPSVWVTGTGNAGGDPAGTPPGSTKPFDVPTFQPTVGVLVCIRGG